MKPMTQPIKDDLLDAVRKGTREGHMVLVPFRATLAPQSGIQLFHKLQGRTNYLLLGMTGSWDGSDDSPFFRLRDISLNINFSDSATRGQSSPLYAYDRFNNLSPSRQFANTATGIYREYRLRHVFRKQSQICVEIYNESADTITASMAMRLLKFGDLK